MAQWLKNPPAVQETQEAQVRPLGREDPLKEGMTTHSRYSCLENLHGQRSLVDYSPQNHRVRHE